ncbi:hypothetical protein, partial [Stenotrophomonas maltophilia]|uniref:hypothetical protein n=1 Tax=Stenotrophomonas maltophilia TaxID=40324 RepID=UPI0013DC25F5
GELGALVKQFAETLQVHEAAIVRASAASAQLAPLVEPEQPQALADAPAIASAEGHRAEGYRAQRAADTPRPRLDRPDPAPDLA